MLILDTDHFSAFIRSGAEGDVLRGQLRGTTEQAVISIITAEEQCRGWLARVAKSRPRAERLLNYRRYALLLQEFRAWRVMPWTDDAEDELETLRPARVRIGTMDLRIAAITLAKDAVLLSRNLRDFERVPGLRVENWLDE